jgi:hypothetical protein
VGGGGGGFGYTIYMSIYLVFEQKPIWVYSSYLIRLFDIPLLKIVSQVFDK